MAAKHCTVLDEKLYLKGPTSVSMIDEGTGEQVRPEQPEAGCRQCEHST